MGSLNTPQQPENSGDTVGDPPYPDPRWTNKPTGGQIEQPDPGGHFMGMVESCPDAAGCQDY